MQIRSLLILVALVLVACGARGPEAPAATPVVPAPSAVQPTNEPQPSLPPALPTEAAPSATSIPPTEVLPSATSIPPTEVLPSATPVPPTAAPTQPPTTRFSEELLFLRGGALWAHDLHSGTERRIAEQVTDFAAGPGAAQIALIRGVGMQSEIWVVGRDGSALRQITRNTRAEASLAWPPDGAALIYASAQTDEPLERTWLALPRWCSVAEVRAVDLASGAETVLAPGCEPALSPDGKRIAYTAPPTAASPGAPTADLRVANSLRLINRFAQNGWNFAKTQGQGPEQDGMFVYGAAWSPDGQRVTYSRYLGTWIDTDINLSEIGRSFEGKGKALDVGFGVMQPARFSPDGRLVALIGYDAGNAVGWEGYGAWRIQLINLDGARTVALPSGPLDVIGQDRGKLVGGQAIAWAPNSSAVAVQLPVGWQPAADPGSWGAGAGEIWRWSLTGEPSEVLVRGVDYGSNLAWLEGS